MSSAKKEAAYRARSAPATAQNAAAKVTGTVILMVGAACTSHKLSQQGAQKIE